MACPDRPARCRKQSRFRLYGLVGLTSSCEVLLLERLEKNYEAFDFIRFEAELRNFRVTRHDSLGEGFFEALDRVAFVEIAERRRD